MAAEVERCGAAPLGVTSVRTDCWIFLWGNPRSRGHQQRVAILEQQVKLSSQLGLIPTSFQIIHRTDVIAGRELLSCCRCVTVSLLGKKCVVADGYRSEEHTSELQSRGHLVC